MDTLFELEPSPGKMPAFSPVEQLRDLERDLDEIYNDIEDCETRISELESDKYDKERAIEKLRQQIASDPDSQRELEAEEERRIEKRREEYLIEKRYKTPYRRDIADYWQQ